MCVCVGVGGGMWVGGWVVEYGYMNDSLITHPYVSAYYYICVRILVYM
jgi:hypothetical protein